MGLNFEFFTDNYFFWSILFLFVLHYCTTYSYGFWASKGVPFMIPIPFFGNTFSSALSMKPKFQELTEFYEYFSGFPYGGIYEFLSPKLLLRDPELIEQVLIKDFSIFMNRGRTVDTKLDPLSNHLVNLNGSQWKSLRAKLTPTFSSGKLKTMLSAVEKCADMLIELLEDKMQNSPAPLEVKEQMARFTMDVIGSCAFGLDLKILHNPESPFMKLGHTAFAPSKLGMLRNSVKNNFPRLLTFFGWKGLPKKMEDFFLNTVKNTIREREENNIQRNDFIQLMMEIKKKEEIQMIKEENEVLLDDTTLAANAFIFLLAGYETTATTLSYLLYEIAKNQQIQQKLFIEVAEVMNKHGGKITWEALKDMKYLEQIMFETLRKYSPLPSLHRKSLKAYKLPNTSLELPAGSSIIVPIHALHHDPKYYPDPEKFDPERFSEENKLKIVKGSYLPFGDGPRICIGLRFAQVEVKVATVKLISKFDIKLNAKTKDPLVYAPNTPFITPIGGIWIDFIPRA